MIIWLYNHHCCTPSDQLTLCPLVTQITYIFKRMPTFVANVKNTCSVEWECQWVTVDLAGRNVSKSKDKMRRTNQWTLLPYQIKEQSVNTAARIDFLIFKILSTDILELRLPWVHRPPRTRILTPRLPPPHTHHFSGSVEIGISIHRRRKRGGQGAPLLMFMYIKYFEFI